MNFNFKNFKNKWRIIMKRFFIIYFIGLILVFIVSCASVKAEPDDVTRTMMATVVAQKSVLVAELDEGSTIADKNNTPDDIITWEGTSLMLKTEENEFYQFISKELFYEGDRVLIKIQNGKVQSVKFSP
jgi:hypothetical protein